MWLQMLILCQWMLHLGSYQQHCLGGPARGASGGQRTHPLPFPSCGKKALCKILKGAKEACRSGEQPSAAENKSQESEGAASMAGAVALLDLRPPAFGGHRDRHLININNMHPSQWA